MKKEFTITKTELDHFADCIYKLVDLTGDARIALLLESTVNNIDSSTLNTKVDIRDEISYLRDSLTQSDDLLGNDIYNLLEKMIRNVHDIERGRDMVL